jgi:hypothetical protein
VVPVRSPRHTLMLTVTGCCGESPLVVGWKKPQGMKAFMKQVGGLTSPPPLLPPAPAKAERAETFAPCGVRMHKVDGFCSTCYDALMYGVRLSDDEVLCVVCAGQTFDTAEELDSTSPPRPPVTLLARTDFVTGRLLADDLGGVPCGRARTLLLSLRPGDLLRCCGCIHHAHVRGRTGSFVGFCVRRQLVLLRLDSFVVCVPLELVRASEDDAVQEHLRMLHTLCDVGTQATLQHGVAAVRAAHTLCGSEALLDAEKALRQLALLQQEERPPSPLDAVDQAVDQAAGVPLGVAYPDTCCQRGAG